MPRKGLVTRRPQASDPVYDSQLVDKFICSMMWEGKKSTAQRAFYGAMEQVAKKTNDDALKIFNKAVENVKPLLEVKTRRVGGASRGIRHDLADRAARIGLRNRAYAQREENEPGPNHGQLHEQVASSHSDSSQRFLRRIAALTL